MQAVAQLDVLDAGRFVLGQQDLEPLLLEERLQQDHGVVAHDPARLGVAREVVRNPEVAGREHRPAHVFLELRGPAVDLDPSEVDVLRELERHVAVAEHVGQQHDRRDPGLVEILDLLLRFVLPGRKRALRGVEPRVGEHHAVADCGPPRDDQDLGRILGVADPLVPHREPPDRRPEPSDQQQHEGDRFAASTALKSL